MVLTVLPVVSRCRLFSSELATLTFRFDTLMLALKLLLAAAVTVTGLRFKKNMSIIKKTVLAAGNSAKLEFLVQFVIRL